MDAETKDAIIDDAEGFVTFLREKALPILAEADPPVAEAAGLALTVLYEALVGLRMLVDSQSPEDAIVAQRAKVAQAAQDLAKMRFGG